MTKGYGSGIAARAHKSVERPNAHRPDEAHRRKRRAKQKYDPNIESSKGMGKFEQPLSSHALNTHLEIMNQ